MIKHAESHLDHALTESQIAHIMTRFADRSGFFIETFEFPEDLGTVPCGLYGPIMGDAPVPNAEWHVCGRCDAELFYGPGSLLCSHPTNANNGAFTRVRGNRAYVSRVVNRPARPTRMVTVIAGPHDGNACILYTAFGGPLAPQEPGDPGCKDPDASRAFWAEHALALESH